MAKTRTQYVCQNCGRTAPSFLGRCPQCSEWNTMVEEVVAECRRRFDITIQEITVTREDVQFKLPRVLAEASVARGAA